MKLSFNILLKKSDMKLMVRLNHVVNPEDAIANDKISSQ